jgi:hypothetical protein
MGACRVYVSGWDNRACLCATTDHGQLAAGPLPLAQRSDSYLNEIASRTR